MDSLATSLRNYLNQAQFSAVHILIRFISDLINVKVLSPKSVLNIYEKMVDLTHEQSSPQVERQKIFFFYNLFSN